MKNKIFSRFAIICDLDYTLVNLNTTNEMLKLISPKKYRILNRLLSLFSILGSILKRDFAKLLLIKFIMYGIPKTDIEKFSKLFFKKIMENGRINLQLISLIQNMRKKEAQKLITILLTASLDVIAKEFKSLGFDYVIGSPTYYEDGKFVGFSDLYRRKREVVRTFFSNQIFERIIIFDDTPDKEFSDSCDSKNCMIIKVRFT